MISWEQAVSLQSDKIKLLLVDDHPVTRAGLRLALEKEGRFDILAEAGNGELAIELALELTPDVILMDITLPGMSGIEASKAIKATAPSCRIIIFTSHDLRDFAIAALEAKCDGYCLKGSDGALLSSAIFSVIEGGIWLDPSIARKLIDVYVSPPSVVSATPPPSSEAGRDILSERELDVLTCVVDGLTNNEIAAKLGLSAQTVKTHLSHVMEKLSASDRTQAAVKALRQGLI